MEQTLLILTVIIPLLSFILLFEGSTFKFSAGWVSTLFFFIGTVIALIQLFQADSYFTINWLQTDQYQFTISLRSNGYSKSMTLLVYFIALLVNIYSIVYMKGEKHYHKYFAYLGLFTFSMLGIVLANNLLFVYGFWELVGLSSYLLIGFWYQNPQATMASKKAFIINRIGDIGFLVAILLLWSTHKTLQIDAITAIPLTGSTQETIIALCIFGACVGKSAQFPLQIWLPDAMQGPTPASALIHAATMVAAGIYLMIQILPICSPDALLFFGFIGSITCFTAALTACLQNDFKKILAYSTISQLGYMVVALSTGKGEVAYLHLFTHAFFKAGLFLCAGIIIHEISHLKIKKEGKLIDPQDIRLMGGLSKHLKGTYLAYLLCYISAVGIPLSAGFISKDFIISNLLELNSNSSLHYITVILTISTILITAYYMTRQLLLVFGGSYRATQHPHFHSIQLNLLIPILILGFASLFFFTSFNPFDAHSSYLFSYLNIHPSVSTQHVTALVISVSFTFVGILVAYLKFKNYQFVLIPTNSGIHNLVFQNFYINKLFMRIGMPLSLKTAQYLQKFDEKILDKSFDRFGTANVVIAHVLKVMDIYIIDGFYALIAWFGNKLADFGKSFQTRKIQDYLLYSLLIVGFILFIIYY